MPKSLKWTSLCKIAADKDYQVEKLEKYIRQAHIMTPCGSSALHFAILGNHKTLEWLLHSVSRIYVNQPNDYGETPLHWAAKEGCPKMIASLLAAGANVNQKDGEGDTPLDWATEYERTDIIGLFSQKKAFRVL